MNRKLALGNTKITSRLTKNAIFVYRKQILFGLKESVFS
ncbi:hypothetical protein AsAng_0048950 [Aureispira anguillae]|uniref:Uncharacterized protein n=1 Tax=Aureispira anguillae TaxID=2864201 RepID=A0A915YJ94_9BACT|nr:hypothetical protein AsAng_0048950 [Aureispira anguillae]